MARGESGRIVIEIDPEVKARLYAVLAQRGKTLKEWFLLCAERFIDEETQLNLPFEMSRPGTLETEYSSMPDPQKPR